MNAEQPTTSIPLPPPGQHSKAFIDLVREFACEGGITRPISDEEACRVLDRFDCPEEAYRPVPDTEGPEFFAELDRRCRSDRPRIDARTVSAYLREMWNGADG